MEMVAALSLCSFYELGKTDIPTGVQFLFFPHSLKAGLYAG